jgi:hypothetical protein
MQQGTPEININVGRRKKIRKKKRLIFQLHREFSLCLLRGFHEMFVI